MASYACIEHKSVLKPGPCNLRKGQEAIGDLIEILETESFVVAVFSWGSISLPLELAGELRDLRGKRIAILHLEGWHIRVLDAEAYA